MSPEWIVSLYKPIHDNQTITKTKIHSGLFKNTIQIISFELIIGGKKFIYSTTISTDIAAGIKLQRTLGVNYYSDIILSENCTNI